jgi:hypothetical protein
VKHAADSPNEIWDKKATPSKYNQQKSDIQPKKLSGFTKAVTHPTVGADQRAYQQRQVADVFNDRRKSAQIPDLKAPRVGGEPGLTSL